MKSAATSKPKPRPKPPPSSAPPPPPPEASSSSSSAADPNSKRSGPTPTPAAAAAVANPPNGAANHAPILPSPHQRLPSPHHHLPPPPQPSRPLLTVAAVEAAMASIPPPPQYGLESLDRRNVVLSDGTVRTYFALPLEPPPQLRQPLPLPLPPFPARQLGPPVGHPPPTAERWPPMRPPSAVLPMPPPKRKWEGQANGSAPGESSGRQQQQHQQKPEEKRVAKQAKGETPELDEKQLKSSFLKMVKLMNENTEQKKNYRANGKISQLKCIVCGSVKPLSGKDGQRSMLVKFASSLAGLSEAERLAQSLEKQGHGRAEWYRVRSVPPSADGGSNPLLVKVGVKGERTWVLYGYLATAWDLDALDLESKQNAVIKSRKELDLSE
uniref:XS domain-containing protein n=1 Tax=Oryza punctata TaxID=4537 RepID=A0A0E0MGK5_ORYPU